MHSDMEDVLTVADKTREGATFADVVIWVRRGHPWADEAGNATIIHSYYLIH